jgi:transcriptional regulator with XRE-family HTH domain
MRIQEVVGTQVRRARKAKGWNQADLGEQLGRYLPKRWAPQVVSQAEKGEREFTAAELVALALVLDKPLPAFFMYEGDSIELPNGSVPAFDVRMLLISGDFSAEVAEALTRDTKRLEEQVSEQVRRLNELIVQQPGAGMVEALPAEHSKLSAEESEILREIAFGRTPEEIAGMRGVPPADVTATMERIFEKLEPPAPVENEIVSAAREGNQ